jgi:hypothetical protein
MTTPFTNKTFQPSQEMLTAAENVFVAMAFENTIRPVVEAYQLKILGEREWMITEEFLDHPDQPRQVQKLKDTFLMSESDFKQFAKRCNEERSGAKLHVQSEEFCPLLVAEDMTRVAKTVLIDVMTSITTIRSDDPKLLLDDRAKLVDMTLKLLAPFVKPTPPEQGK